MTVQPLAPNRKKPAFAEMPCDDCTVRELAICSSLDHGELEQLRTIATTAEFEPGATLQQEGDAVESVSNVMSGTLKLYKLLPDGRRQITGFLVPGDFLGLPMGPAVPYAVEAVTKTKLCRFSRRRLVELMGRIPALERRLLDVANEELGHAQDQMLLLGRKTARERLASFLLDAAAKAKRHGGSGEVIDLPMSRADIADFLGLTTETVSRSFTQLKKDKLIELPDPSTVRIANRPGLSAIAAGEIEAG